MTNQDLKEAEEIKCQEKYGRIFNMVTDPILISDLKGKIFDINKAAEKYGLNRSEAMGKNQLKYISKRCLPKVTADFIKVLSGETCQGKVEIIVSKGKILMEYKSHPLIQNNKTTGMISILRDITERKQTEKRTKENEENFRVLYGMSSDAIFILEPPLWKFTSANLSAVNMFGVKNKKEFVSLEPYEVSPKYQPDGQLSGVKAKKNIMKAMKNGSNFFEWVYKRKKGEDFFATVLLNKVEGKDWRYLQATVRDISEQKEAKRKEAEKIKELERVNDLMVSRELKMIKLKKEINEFCKLLRRKNKYNNKDLNI